jgi:cofilin
MTGSSPVQFWLTNRLSVHPDCIEAFNDLKLGKNGTKYIIYKISDDLKEVVVDEVSKETDYDVFREKLENAKEKNGKSRPSYAVYDVAFDLDGGEGHRFGT